MAQPASWNGLPVTVSVSNRVLLSVHCTEPVVTLRRLGFSDEMVACSSKVSPQVAVVGVIVRVVFVAHPNSIPAAKLVPACRLKPQQNLDKGSCAQFWHRVILLWLIT